MRTLRLKAAPGRKLVLYDEVGRIIAHRRLLEDGVYDYRIKAFIAPFAVVEESIYYTQALAHGDAVLEPDHAVPERPVRALRGKE